MQSNSNLVTNPFCQAQPQPQFNWAELALFLINLATRPPARPPVRPTPGLVVKKLEISTTDIDTLKYIVCCIIKQLTKIPPTPPQEH